MTTRRKNSILPARVADVLKLEVYLFGGVPERPEPVFGRDANASVLSRTTRSAPSRAADVIQGTGEPLYDCVINLDTLEVTDAAPNPRGERRDDVGGTASSS